MYEIVLLRAYMTASKTDSLEQLFTRQGVGVINLLFGKGIITDDNKMSA